MKLTASAAAAAREAVIMKQLRRRVPKSGTKSESRP